MAQHERIPILLLKTRSQPTDGYHDYLSASESFSAKFIPVLSHAANTNNISALSHLLATNSLKSKYGGLIFTSQRAVEAFSSIINDLSTQHLQIQTTDPDHLDDTPFPLYVVGPATLRTLKSILPRLRSHLPNLNPIITGSHTGNGEALAPFILNHYNKLHTMKLFTFYEAPRLPFIPLLGAGGENYSRRRLERDDERLRKKPLLFLVGETRRDVIPRTLQDEGLGDERVGVEEVEVYSTTVREGFEVEFSKKLQEEHEAGVKIIVVVVFSPQGCEAMLRALGLLEGGQVNKRWETLDGEAFKWVVATIGPTTRDYLKDNFGFNADFCASTPSPEGVAEGVMAFLQEKGLM